MNLLDLFWTFVKLGAVSFGGGYTLVAIATRTLVEKKKWMTHQEVMEYLAMSQSLPGIIAINFAAFIGYRRAGVLGTWIGVLAIILVPTLIILILFPFLSQIHDHPLMIKALLGMKLAVCALILFFVTQLWKKVINTVYAAFVFIGTIILYYLIDLSPIIPLLLAAFIGFSYFKALKRIFNK